MDAIESLKEAAHTLNPPMRDKLLDVASRCTEPYESLRRLRTAAATCNRLFAAADAGEQASIDALAAYDPMGGLQIVRAALMLEAAADRIEREMRGEEVAA